MSEIAFSINPQATLNQCCLVLDLLEVNKENFSYQIASPLKERTVPQWRSLAMQPADQAAFAFLLKEELLFQQRATGKTPHVESFHFKTSYMFPPLKLNLPLNYWPPLKNSIVNGKQLIVDLFGQAEFYYEATTLKAGQLEIRGRLRWGNTDIASTNVKP